MTQENHVNVYRMIIQNSDLPEDDEGRIKFAREYARHATGLENPEHWLEPHRQEPHCRLTISAPAELENTVGRMMEAGLRPAFQEPAGHRTGDKSCMLPLSFQVRNFGRPLEPGMIEDNPGRMTIIAGAIPDLPDAARDILNWTFIEQDPETHAITIHWEQPAPPDEQGTQ